MHERFNMSDEQWLELRRIDLVQENARSAIEDAIWTYREASRIRFSPSASRSRLAKAHKSVSTALADIAALSDDRLALFEIAQGSDLAVAAMPGLTSKRYLSGLTSEMEAANALFMRAIERVKNAKPGARTRAFPIYLLISQLDQILFQHSGKRITRSKKRNDSSRDYIIAVCKLADKNIGSGSIEEGMKRLIHTRGEISRQSRG